jgi:DNA-binding beta-propeller fold protein YncE
MRTVGGLPVVVGLGAAAVAVVLSGSDDGSRAEPGAAAVPRRLAAYSHLTGIVSASPPGAAVALFQHGYGVELLDFPQAVVLGAGGDVYRRVDAAEDRAGAETQGDPAPMLLSPDGTKVAVGDHDTDRPDVVVVDLLTGDTTTHRLPTGRSVLPVAWSRDGRTLAHLLSSTPTDPYTGERIAGQVGLLDLGDDTADLLPDTDVTAVAFSPDGAELAVEQADTDSVADARLMVVDLASGAERDLASDGVLAGPAAWSPDGRLIATTTLESSGAPVGVPDPGLPAGLAFVDPSGRSSEVPSRLELPLAGPGRVLGWTDDGEVVTLLDVEGYDPCCGPEAYTLSRVPVDGAPPTTLTRIGDLQGYGVGRFQMAASLAADLAVVDPVDVDRGPWPWPWRIGLAAVVGLAAWLAARLGLSVVRRRRS